MRAGLKRVVEIEMSDREANVILRNLKAFHGIIPKWEISEEENQIVVNFIKSIERLSI